MIVNRRPFTVTVLELNKPNKNNRIYTKDNIKHLPKEVLGYSGQVEVFAQHIECASFMAKNLRIEDNKVLADIKILNTPYGDDLQKWLKHVAFRTMGYAGFKNVREGILEVTDFQLVAIYALPKEMAA